MAVMARQSLAAAVDKVAMLGGEAAILIELVHSQHSLVHQPPENVQSGTEILGKDQS